VYTLSEGGKETASHRDRSRLSRLLAPRPDDRQAALTNLVPQRTKRYMQRDRLCGPSRLGAARPGCPLDPLQRAFKSVSRDLLPEFFDHAM
jgi:hypothetical protein